jgi:hypothetical protein
LKFVSVHHFVATVPRIRPGHCRTKAQNQQIIPAGCKRRQECTRGKPKTPSQLSSPAYSGACEGHESRDVVCLLVMIWIACLPPMKWTGSQRTGYVSQAVSYPVTFTAVGWLAVSTCATLHGTNIQRIEAGSRHDGEGCNAPDRLGQFTMLCRAMLHPLAWPPFLLPHGERRARGLSRVQLGHSTASGAPRSGGWMGLWRPREPQGGLRVVARGVTPQSEAGPRPGHWQGLGSWGRFCGGCGSAWAASSLWAAPGVATSQGGAADARRYSACPIPAGPSGAPPPQGQCRQMHANSDQAHSIRRDSGEIPQATLPAKPGVLDPAALCEWPAALTRLPACQNLERAGPVVDEAGDERNMEHSFAWGGVVFGKRCHF